MFLTSIFTHLLPPDVEHYLAEIKRVLKPKGRCYNSFFLFNDQQQYSRSGLDFKYDFGHYRLLNLERPTDAISYREQYIYNLFQQHGLSISTVHYRKQDAIIAFK